MQDHYQVAHALHQHIGLELELLPVPTDHKQHKISHAYNSSHIHTGMK